MTTTNHDDTTASSSIANGSPVALVDPNVAVRNAKRLKQEIPRVEVFYAVKSFNDPEILTSLRTVVSGYDVASLGEIEELLDLGIAPERMLYSNPVKIPSHISRAAELGIDSFAFDSVDEIDKLARDAPGSKVYLRILVPDHDSTFPLSRKFGVDPAHAVEYASAARRRGLIVRGLAFHVGSQCQTANAWRQAIQLAGTTIESLRDAEIDVDLLNIGGGFPARYQNGLSAELDDIARTINAALDEHIPETIRVVAEPGRYISADTTVIYTTVIGREHRPGDGDWLYLDVGAFQGLMEPLSAPTLRYPISNVSRALSKPKRFVLTGPTCDADDLIGTDYVLPHDTSTGDILAIESAGAYTLVYASSFNGFRPPSVAYVRQAAGEGADADSPAARPALPLLRPPRLPG